MLANSLPLMMGSRFLTAVEDNSRPLALVSFSLKLMQADSEVLRELLILSQALKQLLVVILNGHNGAHLFMRNCLVVLVTRLGASATAN